MERISNTSIIVALLVVVAVGAFGLRPVSEQTQVLSPVDLPDPSDDHTAAVVAGRVRSGGLWLLGLQLGSLTHTIGVTFYTGPNCFSQVTTGEAWPMPDRECASPVLIAGVISGGGIAPTGETIVTVDVEVTGDCYETISLGDEWPPRTAACS